MSQISVIIPVYNGEEFIGRTLKSILEQTFQGFEIIVIDDASTDKTKEIVKKFQLSDKRIRLIELEKNSGGPSIPTNIGIKQAKENLIAILEADDFYLPTFLEQRLRKLREENLDWIIGGAFYFRFPEKSLARYVIGGSVSTWLIKREVFEKWGYFKSDQDGVQDIGFSLRVTKPENQIKIGLDPTPLTVCFIHQKSGTYFSREKAQIFIKCINSLLLDFWGSIAIESIWYWRLGNYYCIEGKMTTGRRYFKKSLQLKFSFIPILLYFLSFFGQFFYFNCWLFLKKIQEIFEKFKSFYWILAKYNFEYKVAKRILK